jgi:hypothetical protein
MSLTSRFETPVSSAGIEKAIDPAKALHERARAVADGLKWPMYRSNRITDVQYIEISSDALRAKALARYAVLYIYEIDSNAYLEINVVGAKLLEEEGAEPIYQALPDHRSYPRFDSDDQYSVRNRTLRELKALATYLNAQLIPKGYRVQEVIYHDISYFPERKDKHYAGIRETQHVSLNIPIEVEFWEKGLRGIVAHVDDISQPTLENSP